MKWARLEKETGERRNTKGRSGEIQSTRAWTGCNISSSKLQQAATQKEGGGESPELCRFVSEGEKSAARSNGPLIFLSCIKGSVLLGRMCRWTSSSYIHCLSYALFQCIDTPPWNQLRKKYAVQASVSSPHKETKPLYFGFYCAFQKNYSILFLWQGLPRLSETLKSDKQRFDTLPHSLLVSCILFWLGWCFIRTEKKTGLLYSCFCQAVSQCRLLSALIVVNHDKRVQTYPSILSSCYLSTLGIKLPLKKKQRLAKIVWW